MKIIFLDMDGAIATAHHAWKEETLTRISTTAKNDEEAWAMMIDPAAVANLNRLVELSGAKIVLSSAWRVNRTLEEIVNILCTLGGITKQIIDVTPTLYDGDERASRGEEIDSWMKRTRVSVDTYVILDDYPHMLPEQLPHFVHCDGDTGFADQARFEQALQILEAK